MSNKNKNKHKHEVELPEVDRRVQTALNSLELVAEETFPVSQDDLFVVLEKYKFNKATSKNSFQVWVRAKRKAQDDEKEDLEMVVFNESKGSYCIVDRSGHVVDDNGEVKLNTLYHSIVIGEPIVEKVTAY
ncbi:MAG TPA: hypothetical protein VNZ45_04260 [Bacteroidia bacterium]|jgi:hypothetical protein|nr:hypothetical protein [Bacteroidia bacterium]